MNDATIDMKIQVAPSDTVLVLLESIRPNPYQVRLSEDPEAVAKIAASIEQHTMLQIPTARRVNGHHELAFGHTRYAAYTALLGQGKTQYASMPLVVRELTDAQMFEMAVTENVQRRDLNPIEEAQAMQRALTEFGYTSEQVGELFGVSAVTVRGKVRLLALPKAVQDRVQSGELNEGVSRALLSAAKVMTPEQLKEAGKTLASGMYDTDEAGEYLAQQMSRDLQEMWHKWDKGEEPRGGHGLWPLTWKHAGLPPMTPGAVIKQLKLDMKPEQIAGMVEILNAGMELPAETNIDADSQQKIQVLVNPPACTDCPMYVRLNGSHFCGLKACWERKLRTWAQTEFNRIARELGIPVYANEKTDGTFRRHNWETRKDFIQMMKAKDPDLRLVMTPKGEQQDECTGSQFVELVDVNPKRVAADQRKNQVNRSVSTPRNPVDAAKELAEQKRRDQLQDAGEKFVEQAAPVFAQAFKPLTNTAVLRVLLEKATDYFNQNQRKIKAATVAELRQMLALALLTEDIGEPVIPYYDVEKGPEHAAKFLQGVAKEWGVKLPADWMERAKGMMPKEPESTTKAARGAKGKSKGKKK